MLGFAVGAASFVSPLYISELAPKKLRGGMVSPNQLMVEADATSPRDREQSTA